MKPSKKTKNKEKNVGDMSQTNLGQAHDRYFVSVSPGVIVMVLVQLHHRQ